MYCKKCGKLLGEGDKFCSNCGTRAAEDFVPAFRRDEPAESARQPQEAQPEERPRRKIHIEEFNWDLDGYPTAHKKTEDIDFNWSSVLEEKRQDRYGSLKQEPAQQEEGKDEDGGEGSLEDAIFADMGNLETEGAAEDEEPTRILGHREKRTEFYTYNKKNEALQAMLDKEYEKLRNGDEPEEEPEDSQAGDGRSPEEVMADLLEKAEPAAGGQEAGAQPENPPSKEKEKVAVEFVGVVLSQPPKGMIAVGKEAAEKAASGAKTADTRACAAPETVSDPQAEAAGAETGRAAGEKPKTCPPSEEKEKEEHKLTFDDVFGDDDDSDENPKKGRVLKVIAVILCILVAAELVMIGIQYFAPQSDAAKAINKAYGTVMDLFSGKGDKADAEPAEADPEEDEQEGPLAPLIAAQKDKGKNIVLIEEDQTLTFDDGEDYGFADLGSAYTFTDKPWYTDDGVDVTYGQELVGTLVQYYSSWIDKINGKNNKVLKVIDETSDFYEEIESLEGDEDLEYGMNRLAIGDVRVGNTGFYVRTSVTVVDSKQKEKTEEHIVYMEPDEKAMKIVAVKKI